MKSKIIFLTLIGFILMIALMSINGTVQERQVRQLEADNNIAKVFAGQQQVVGPFVTIKFRETWTQKVYNHKRELVNEKKHNNVFTKVYFPSSLDYTSFLSVEERSRGIYKTQIYRTVGRIKGAIFIPKTLDSRKREGSTIKILASHLVLSISDIRGFSDEPKVSWNGGKAVAARSKQNSVQWAIPVTGLGVATPVPFSVDLKVHGLKSFHFAPIASRTHFKLKSSWPHPSFTGNFLPVTRDISDKGFDAEWSVSAVASTAQSHIRNIIEHGNGVITAPQTLGVELIKPSNPYSLTDRALKYGFLFIGCTFAAFFFFETLGKLKIHPIQYGFVGFAQTLFFLLLLSLSEHISFGVSYFFASLATVATITYYLISVLKGIKRGVLFGGGLLAVYGALYGLLMSEDHALVIGSILIFVVLAVVMAQTRNVDWYALGDTFDKKADTSEKKDGAFEKEGDNWERL